MRMCACVSLNLLGLCVKSGADGPDRLVRDFEFFYITFGNSLQRRVELARDHRRGLIVCRSSMVSPTQRIAPHTVTNHGKKLLRDHVVSFAKNMAPLGMTDEDKVATDLCQHRGADFAGKGAAFLPMAVLRGKL